MIYETDKVALRPYDKKFIEESISWFNDLEVIALNSHGRFPMTIEKAEEYYEEIKNSNNLIVWNIFAIKSIVHSCLDIEKELVFIGNISLQSIDFINRSAELAIIIGNKKYWKRGLGTEACRCVLYHAFMRLGLERVWSGTSILNKGMNNIFKKLNFTKEGVFRKAILNFGKLVDINCYSILKEEWNDPIIF